MTDWSFLGAPLWIIAICLGVGSCNYLTQVSDNGRVQAKAALIAAERCGSRP